MKTRENNVRRKDMSLKIYYSDRIEELAKELKMHLLQSGGLRDSSSF